MFPGFATHNQLWKGKLRARKDSTRFRQPCTCMGISGSVVYAQVIFMKNVSKVYKFAVSMSHFCGSKLVTGKK